MSLLLKILYSKPVWKYCYLPDHILSLFLLAEACYYPCIHSLQGHELKNGDPISGSRNELWWDQPNHLSLFHFGSRYFIYCPVTKYCSVQPGRNFTGKLLYGVFLTKREIHKSIFSLLFLRMLCQHVILELQQPSCHHKQGHPVK